MEIKEFGKRKTETNPQNAYIALRQDTRQLSFFKSIDIKTPSVKRGDATFYRISKFRYKLMHSLKEQQSKWLHKKHFKT